MKETKAFKLQLLICVIILTIFSVVVFIFNKESFFGDFIIVPVVDVILLGIFIRFNTILSKYETILNDESEKNKRNGN